MCHKHQQIEASDVEAISSVRCVISSIRMQSPAKYSHSRMQITHGDKGNSNRSSVYRMSRITQTLPGWHTIRMRIVCHPEPCSPVSVRQATTVRWSAVPECAADVSYVSMRMRTVSH